MNESYFTFDVITALDKNMKKLKYRNSANVEREMFCNIGDRFDQKD